MRAIASCAVLLLLVSGPAAAQRQVQDGRPLEPNGFVRIFHLTGSVRVIGWDRDSVAVAGKLGAAERFAFGGGRTGVKIGIEPGLEAPEPAPASYLEVRVPARSHVWIKTSTGDITVTDFSGTLDAYTVTGSIRIAGAPREVTAESMGGDVEVDGDLRWLRAKTAGGDIRLNGSGDDASVSTVSGTIVVASRGFQRGRFESVDGDIRYDGAIPRGAALEFLNHSAQVELVLPARVSAEFSIHTLHGSVENEFGSSRLVTARDLQGKQLTFTVGTFDGTRVEVRNFKGKTILRKKP
ncbi:MAG: hypothetical protein HY561_03770 [Gemmatimonadetes bacterium]|nr:hypothetical protein [Gemmatimonadota bacterium]